MLPRLALVASLLGGLVLAGPGCALEAEPDEEESAESAESVDESEEAAKITRRFDFATTQCGGGEYVCPEGRVKCFCEGELDLLNYDDQRHFLVVGSDRFKAKINAAGNYQAAYWDRLNDTWEEQSGKAFADHVMAKLRERMPSGVPEWVHLNEISVSRWPDIPAYRRFVIDVATRLKKKHGKSVVVYSPFQRPRKHADDWAALAKVAFIGAEIYLSGKEVNASGNSVAWCREQYEESRARYAKLGVPKSRLMLLEHFGQTKSDAGWGRAGVSDAGWKNAIRARAAAARQLDFAGYVTYGWGGNKMLESTAARHEFMKTYRALALP